MKGRLNLYKLNMTLQERSENKIEVSKLQQL